MLLKQHAELSIELTVVAHAVLLGTLSCWDLLGPQVVASAGHAVHVMNHAAYPFLLAICPTAQQAAVDEGCAVHYWHHPL